MNILHVVEDEPAATSTIPVGGHSVPTKDLRDGVRRLRAEALPERGLSKTLAQVGVRRPQGMVATVRRAALFRKLQRAGACAAAVLSVAFIGWVRYANVEPQVDIPVQIMPKANALDTWEQAYAATGNMKLVEKVLGVHAKLPTSPSPADLKAWKQLVVDNSKAFSLIRQGLGEEFARKRVTSYSELMPEWAHFRSLGRLMALEARVQLETGKPDEALATALDLMQMGGKMQGSGAIIGRMVGQTVGEMGRSVAWKVADSADLKSARHAVMRIEELEKRRVPVSQSLREEMYSGQSALQNTMRGGGWRNELASAFGIIGEADDPIKRNAIKLALYAYTKRGVMQNYTHALEEQIAKANLLPPVMEFVEPKLDILTSVLAPIYGSLGFSDARSVVDNRMLMVANALRAYRLENGAFPEKIDDLKGKYLKNIPRDPFRPAESLCYQRTSSGYKIYSVGPDGIDQGGKPFVNHNDYSVGNKKNPSLQMESVGDIVARTEQN